MKGIPVRTGKYREEAVRRSGITPDLVIDSLAEDLPDHI
ncbi:MAG: HAD hydrolase-like protein [Methanoculleus sp.]|jgi:ribonucleotide monophosphatase NagD (HAD superfamily)